MCGLGLSPVGTGPAAADTLRGAADTAQVVAPARVATTVLAVAAG